MIEFEPLTHEQISRLAALQKEYTSLYEEKCLLGVSYNNIQLDHDRMTPMLKDAGTISVKSYRSTLSPYEMTVRVRILVIDVVLTAVYSYQELHDAKLYWILPTDQQEEYLKWLPMNECP